MSRILSIDTSNYTTSACLFDTASGVVWENRIMLPVTSGSCGLRQSEAVFLHNKNFKSLFDSFVKSDIDYVAASSCPSERTDSYMPCFIVGHSLASVISNMYNVPLYICSHQKNHIGAALYSGNCTELLDEEFFAFHISGGTTDILLCKCSDGVLNISKVGGTADISCGQLIDRAGVAMNLPFPCGKYIENHSTGILKGNIRISNKDYMYNFSGFENKVMDKISNGETVSQVSDFVLDVAASFVMDSVKKLRNNYKHIPVLLSGGVMSNKYISSFICENVKDVYFANNKYSSDNALGTAFMCAYERGLLNE